MKRLQKAAALFFVLLFLLALPVFAEGDDSGGGTALSKPQELKAVVLQPGQDFEPTDIESDCITSIEQAIAKAVEYEMNAIFVPVNLAGGTLYTSDSWPMQTGFDLLQVTLDKAKAEGLYVYGVFDAACGASEGSEYGALPLLTAATVQSACVELNALTSRYELDGVYLTGYYNQKTAQSMMLYKTEGSGMGFENWVRECATSLVVNASEAVKSAKDTVVFGLLTDPVWANNNTEPSGSATNAAFEMYTDGAVDLNAIFTWGQIDQLLVKCPGALADPDVNFKEVLAWWGQMAEGHSAKIAAYICNDKLGSDEAGWKAPDQVMRQVIQTRNTAGCEGAAFASLTALNENKSGATSVLLRYYQNEIQEQDILTDLSVSKPEKRTYTTQEPQAIFYGASDPNFPLTINGTELNRNGEGVFSAEIDLKPGLNTLNFEHKEKSIVYNITRKVVIINSVSPAGSITVEGNTQIGITVMAYSGSNITASLAGATVTLVEEELADDTADGSATAYVPYKGTLTMPAAGESEQDIGSISVGASWSGISQNASGARVYVASLPKQAPNVEGQKGNLVEVTASQARTYPSGVLNNDPYGNCFPLPKGTVDYIVSDKLSYEAGSSRGEYYLLGSGLRVGAGDVSSLGEQDWALSPITSTNSWADGEYLYVSLTRGGRKTAYTVNFPGVPYSSAGGAADFSPSQMSFTFSDTSVQTDGIGLAGNNVFSGASLTQNGNSSTLTLNFRKSGAFLGYRAYYDGDNLVLRFHLIPSGLGGAKIYIDPGHGGNDSGTAIAGMYTEKSLNADLAGRVAQILRERGANVQVTDTSGYVGLDSRISMSQNYSPHLFVSIHHNSGVSSAAGTECFFFNPYSRTLSRSLSADVAGALETRNRGGKYGAYRVTTHMDFPAVLLECGFLTNPNELSKLQKDNYKHAIATAIANSIQNNLQSMN